MTEALRAQSNVFASVEQLAGGEFFQHNALLFAAPNDVQANAAKLIKAKPFLERLASDPSLHGIAIALSMAISGVEQGQLAIEELSWPLGLAFHVSLRVSRFNGPRNHRHHPQLERGALASGVPVCSCAPNLWGL